MPSSNGTARCPNSDSGVRELLAQRFIPDARPRFAALRRRGDVVLWKSTTHPHMCLGGQQLSETRYFISVGDELDYLFIKTRERAEQAFAFVCAGAGVAYLTPGAGASSRPNDALYAAKETSRG